MVKMGPVLHPSSFIFEQVNCLFLKIKPFFKNYYYFLNYHIFQVFCYFFLFIVEW